MGAEALEFEGSNAPARLKEGKGAWEVTCGT